MPLVEALNLLWFAFSLSVVKNISPFLQSYEALGLEERAFWNWRKNYLVLCLGLEVEIYMGRVKIDEEGSLVHE